MLLLSSAPPIDAIEYFEISSVDAPSNVGVEVVFSVDVSISYNFQESKTIKVGIWDVEEDNYASGDDSSGSWIQDSISGSGIKVFTINITAINTEKIWILRAYILTDDFEYIDTQDFSVEIRKLAPNIRITSFSSFETELGIDLEKYPVFPRDIVDLKITLENEGTSTGKNVYFVVEDFVPTTGLTILYADPPRDLQPGESGLWKVQFEAEQIGEYNGFYRVIVDGELLIEEALTITISDFPIILKSYENIPGEDETIYPGDTITLKLSIANSADRIIRQIDLKVNMDSKGLTVLGVTPVHDLYAKESSEWLIQLQAEEVGEYIMTVDLYAQGVEVSPEVFTLTTYISTKPFYKCLIATATYGSELSPQVNFLRNFRDSYVLKSFAGSQFMYVFNWWYYSFSPVIASFIAEHQLVKYPMKVILFPLLNILQVSSKTFSFLNFNVELAVITAGLIASIGIGIIYFSPFLFLYLRVRRNSKFCKSCLRYLSKLWIISISLIVIGEFFALHFVMMMGTTLFVLATIGISAFATSSILINRRSIVPHISKILK